MLLARTLATAIVVALFATSTSAAAAPIAVPLALADAGGDASAAASLSVGPGVLTQGSSATITYVNPGMAGQWVAVQIDNGLPRGGQVQVVEILLDAKGRGSGTWTVPCWAIAKFNAPGAGEVGCMITR